VTISTAAATSVTESTEDPFVFYQGQVYATSGAISAYTVPDDDSRLCQVNSFDFTINNNVESVWYVSGTCSTNQSLRGAKAVLVKGRDYESTINLNFDNKTMYQRFLGSNTATTPEETLNKYQIVLDFVRSGTIGSNPKLATDNWIRLVLGSCAFNSENISASPEDLVAEPLDVSVESAKIYVVDDDASYS
jgi:hypothetical protein